MEAEKHHLLALSALALALSWGSFIFLVFQLQHLTRHLPAVEKAWLELEHHLKERLVLVARLVDLLDQFASQETLLIHRLKLALDSYMCARTIPQRIESMDALSPLIEDATALAPSHRTLSALGIFQDTLDSLGRAHSELQPALERFESVLAVYNSHLAQMRFRRLARLLGFHEVPGFKTLSRVCVENAAAPADRAA